MTFDFTVKEFILGNGTGLGQPFQFYRRGFQLGGSGSTPTELIKEFFGYPIQTAYSLAGDLINWKLYGNSVQRLLPEGYTQLESIKSTGTQWIDTGYVMTSDVVEYGISLIGKNSSANTSLFGSEETTIPKYSGVVYGNKLYIGSSSSLASFTWADDKNDIVVKTTSDTSGTLTHNGLDIPFTYSGGIQKTRSIGLFSNNRTEQKQLSSIETKHFYIKDNGVLVRDLVTAKRDSDGAVGMYDLCGSICPLTGTSFYINAGTGSFTAGAVAPTPNSPIEIKSVGDRTKNLLNRPNGTYSSSDRGGITVSNNITTLNVQFSSTWSIYKLTGSVDSTNIAGSLTDMKSKSTDNVLFKSGHTYIVKLFDSTDNYYDLHIVNTTTNMSITDGVPFTPSEDFNALWTRMNQTGSGSQTGNKTFKITIVEGSVAPSSYVPYGYQIPVMVGSQGFVDLGTLSWYYSETLGCGKTFYATLTAKNANGQVICSCAGFTGITANSAYSAQRDVDKVCWIEDGRSIRFHDDIYNGNTTAFKQAMSGVYLYYQRTTDTSWIPPTTKTVYLSNPLRKVGTYADYIDYENQQVVRNVGICIFDGTESWVFGTMSPQVNSIYLVISDMMEGLRQAGVCTHFINTQNIIDGGIWFGRNSKQIYILSSSFTSVEVAKAYLASEYAKGTPVIVEYPLATPVTEPLTVPALTMAVGTNIITTETEVKPSDMYIKGYVSQL